MREAVIKCIVFLLLVTMLTIVQDNSVAQDDDKIETHAILEASRTNTIKDVEVVFDVSGSINITFPA